MAAAPSTERSRLHPGWIVAIALGALLSRTAACSAPFALDDFAQHEMLDGDYAVRRSPLDLFNFATEKPAERAALMDRGLLPWWTSEDFRLAMFRPLASALMAADRAVFGNNPIGPHIHSLVWLALLVVAALSLYRRALPLRLALIAASVFALDECHNVAVVWLANRSTSIAGTLGVLAVAMHVRWRELGEPTRVRDAALPIGLAALAMAAGEYALTVLLYVPLYEWLVAKGSARSRLVAALPTMAIVAAFALAARALGYGVRGSEVYVDPLLSPVAFLRSVSERMPMLLAQLLAGRPIDTPGNWPPSLSTGTTAIVAVALLSLAVVGTLVRLGDATVSRRVAWFASGALLGLVPLCAAFPSERLLLGPALGFAGVLGVLLAEIGSIATDEPRSLGFWSRWAVAVTMALVHLPWAGWRAHEATRTQAALLAGIERAIAESPVEPRGLEHAQVVLIAAADAETLHYPATIWHRRGLPRARGWRVLAMGTAQYAIKRTAADTLEVVSASPMFANFAAAMFRGHHRSLAAGSVVRVDGMTVTTVDASPQGPRHASFRFDRPLDDRSLRFYVAFPDGLVPLPIPAVGEQLVLPPAAVPVRL